MCAFHSGHMSTADGPHLARVTVCALELREVAEVDRVLEAPVPLVARGALKFALRAERDRVPERAVRGRRGHSALGLIQRRVADTAVLPYHTPRVADQLAVVAAEAALKVEVADVVGVRLPVGL